MADHRERGTTLTEVLVVLVITTLLGVPLLGLLTSTARAEAGQSELHDARIELDAAALMIERDLANATPSATGPSGGTNSDRLAIEVSDSVGGERLIYWWQIAFGLLRLEWDPATRRWTSLQVVSYETDLPADGFVRYFDATGNELQPALVGGDRLAACTTLVEVTLAVPVGDDVETTTITRAVRSRPPGGNGC